MKLKKGIKTPAELREVLEIAKDRDMNYYEAIWAMHKYKWYNWYQNLHIKMDSPEDQENTLIFKDIQDNYPQIHEDIEINISAEVEKLKEPL